MKPHMPTLGATVLIVLVLIVLYHMLRGRGRGGA